MCLPGGFLYTRDLTATGELTETDTADAEHPHVTVFTATAETPAGNPGGKLLLLL